ncbi:VanW family protein [Paenibacillus sp. 1P07SE]|uniref:VanW family protein n=1 Tax=Paenibacillus sp. 1P07SE TaxID=3132209 RepID=UPI0039A4AEFC
MKKIHLAAIVISAILLLASTSWGLLNVYAGQDTVPDGTVVDGRPIGGLTIERAQQELEDVWSRFEEQEVMIQANLTKDAGQSWSLRELGFKVEREPLQRALLELREGSLLERARYRLSFPRQHRIRLAWNRQLFEERIRSQWGWLDLSETADAQRRITTDDKVVYRGHRDAYRIDMNALSGQMRTEAASWWRKYAAARSQGEEAAPHSEVGKPYTLKLPITVLQPELTLEKLRAQGVERRISSHTTDYSASPAGRAFNVEATARTLQNWELAPGEIFDYGQVIAAAEQQYGFREAPVILNGEFVPGVGGGICQVSSTLYQAALMAGLAIVERRNHSLPVSYMPLGQDATFAEGAINFRFRNTTGKHLVIRTETKDRKLTVKLFGTLPTGTQYEIHSRIVQTIDPPVVEVASVKAAPGRPVQLNEGKPGYVVETYRTKLQDGKEISRERISRDTYKPTPRLIGIAADEAEGDQETLKSEQETLLEDGLRLAP